MHIAITAKRTVLHKGSGGLETQTHTLAKGFINRGHSVIVFSPNWELNQESEEKDGVKYVFIKCIYRMGPFFGFFGNKDANNCFNKSYEYLKKFHDQNPFDIVLSQSSTGVGIIKRKHELNLKVISIAHGTIVSEYTTFVKSMRFPRDLKLFIQNTGFSLKNFFLRQRQFVHGSDKVICVSNFVKNNLAEETFSPEEKFVVIHNGIDDSKFEDFKLSSRGIKALHVGRIEKSKGIDNLIELFSDDRLKNFELDVIGDGEYFDEAKQLAAKVPQVHFVGKRDYSDVINNYFKNNEYGLFLFPTKRVEGFPMVLVEALFAGLPIVATDMGGVSDAVIDDKTGFLVPSDRSGEFINKVEQILTDDILRDNMSRRAQEFAKENFTLEIMINKYIEVIQEVLSK